MLILNVWGSLQGGDSSPLHRACSTGRADIVEMLIQAGASISAKDKVSRSPMMIQIFLCVHMLMCRYVYLFCL
jgi:ankyrin repeat protein